MKEMYSKPMIARQRETCATFLLNTDNAFLIGHNLDEISEDDCPGAIFVNKRGQTKTTTTHFEMSTGIPSSGKRLTWTAEHGSVTFNSFGKDFPDGGINEAGLYIQEMSQIGGALPENSELPCMFMTLWMQYVLDNFTTAREVIDSLSDVTIDGWPWHFFVCDAGGHSTSIDWIDGKPVIHTGGKMPYPVMTNDAYDDELATLKPYQGFGGDKPVDLSDMGDKDPRRDTRFVHACHLLQTGPNDASIEDAFKILYAMDRSALMPPGGRQWSYVIDLKAGKLYVETRTAKRRRFIDINALDFSNTEPTQMVDIHLDQEGDITAFLQPATFEANREVAQGAVEWINSMGGVEAEIEAYDRKGEPVPEALLKGSLEIFFESVCSYAEKSRERTAD